MSRAKSLLLLIVLLVGVLTAPAESSTPPNIVFILADDLGWSDVGCYGGDLVETPNIDKLAAQGTRFTDAYAASPVCSPTRASILTGKHPARLHMTIWREGALNPPKNRKFIPAESTPDLPLNEISLAQALKSKGYLTALVGKWHLGDAQHYPESFGFDINIGGTLWGAPNTYFFPYSGSGTFDEEFRYVPHLEFGKSGEYLTDRLTDEALKIMEHAGTKPFFLYLAHHAPHTPIEGKSGIVEHYQEKLKTDPKLHHKNAQYAAMIQSLDESVGRVLAKIDELGIADHTIVIFFSDNGGYVNAFKKQKVTDNFPLRSGKGSVYEGGVREPLIVRWPGVTKAGSICHEPVISTDFFPTLAHATQVEAKLVTNAVDGLDLVTLLRDPESHLQRDALYFHYPHYYETTGPVSAIRSGDWKLLHYYEGDRLELYNLKNDLSEQHNLAKEMPQRADELHKKLDHWKQQVNAAEPQLNPAKY